MFSFPGRRSWLLSAGCVAGLLVMVIVVSSAGGRGQPHRSQADARGVIARWLDDGTCLSIQNERRSPRMVAPDYPLGFAARAQLITYVSCLEAGPGTHYMRFRSSAALSAALTTHPQVQRLGLCRLDHELFDDDTLDPVPLGGVCRALHGTLLPLTPGKRGYQAPPMTDDSTCATYLRASRLDQADYVARQHPFSIRRDPGEHHIVAAAAAVARACERARQKGKAAKTRVYSALSRVLGVRG